MNEQQVSSDLSEPARYTQQRRAHWDAVAQRGQGRRARGYYLRRLGEVYRHLIPAGSSVLEIGCGEGDLLAAVAPDARQSVGVDLAPAMVEQARQRFPELTFHAADVHELDLGRTFDFIILSDTLNDLWDVRTALQRVRAHCRPDTRVIVNIYSRLWQWPLALMRSLGLARPLLPQSWLTREDVQGLLHLAGFETFRTWQEVLCPLRIPLVNGLCDRMLVKLWPGRHLALTNFLIARPAPAPAATPPRVSVIVPARNESGHIADLLARTPQMGAGTELVFVEGNSTDDTYDVIARAIAGRSDCQLHRQTGKGKGDAVRLGFAQATGEVLMILDADITVPPEALPQFYAALVEGKGEFINGVRLVYPMAQRAMRPLNFLGNKFFSLAFSWLLGQPIKDTLCGTKVLYKRDYERIAANRAYFGDFDPFGDFDLIFGAAKLNLRIVDLPVRYGERVYGDTNINRWRHGWLLLRMTCFALRRLKFV